MAEYTLAQVRYFVAAAGAGSMTAAAAELHVAQSAVSSAVAALERALGVQLFIRQHARGLVLTAAGRRLYREAQALLVHAADLEESARSISQAVSGRITLGCFITLAPFTVPAIRRLSARQYPRLDLRIAEQGTEDLLESLHDGTTELALMYDLDLGDAYETLQLGQAAPYVIVSADHRLAGASSVRLADLQQEPLIMLDIPRSSEYFEELLASAGVRPEVQYRSSSYETVRGLVAEGQGWALLNQRPVFATTYGGRSVVALSLIDDAEPLPIVLVRLADSRSTRRVRALSEVCASVVSNVLRGAGPIEHADDRSSPPLSDHR